MLSTITDPHAIIQDKIDNIAKDNVVHNELSVALILLTQESQERVAGILSSQGERTTLLDLQELLLEFV